MESKDSMSEHTPGFFNIYSELLLAIHQNVSILKT